LAIDCAKHVPQPDLFIFNAVAKQLQDGRTSGIHGALTLFALDTLIYHGNGYIIPTRKQVELFKASNLSQSGAIRRNQAQSGVT